MENKPYAIAVRIYESNGATMADIKTSPCDGLRTCLLYTSTYVCVISDIVSNYVLSFTIAFNYIKQFII